MPSRNVIKVDVPDNYYHVYARGVSKMPIYLDDEDYTVFLSLFKRYLSSEAVTDEKGRPYQNFRDEVELLAYCLMPNHFHMLFFQHDEGVISALMKGILTSYSRYFNRKYNRTGPLLETRYKSSLITTDAYLMHISRYIHLNPENWRSWEWSSLPYYLNGWQAEWLQPDRIKELFSSVDIYEEFVSDYESAKKSLKAIKHELADR